MNDTELRAYFSPAEYAEYGLQQAARRWAYIYLALVLRAGEVA